VVESTGLLIRRRVNSLPQVRILSSPFKNPGFTRVFRISGQLLWLSCLSMLGHACRCCVVSYAALPTAEPMVAPVPEPSMMVIGSLFGLGGLMARRRMKK
jgi:hypothetical protein